MEAGVTLLGECKRNPHAATSLSARRGPRPGLSWPLLILRRVLCDDTCEARVGGQARRSPICTCSLEQGPGPHNMHPFEARSTPPHPVTAGHQPQLLHHTSSGVLETKETKLTRPDCPPPLPTRPPPTPPRQELPPRQPCLRHEDHPPLLEPSTEPQAGSGTLQAPLPQPVGSLRSGVKCVGARQG